MGLRSHTPLGGNVKTWFYLFLSASCASTLLSMDKQEPAIQGAEELKARILRDYENSIKDKISWQSQAIQWIGGPRAALAFNHSLLKEPRKVDDLMLGKFSQIDVWQYQFRDPKTYDVLTDKKPISTQKKHWKSQGEARIISMTFYGSLQKYIDGLTDFIDSIQHIKRKNNVHPHKTWGYETFTIRVYVAARNPENSELGPLGNAVDPGLIKTLLDRGCEIAFVDNHLDKVGRDATFWRFLVADEPMEPGARIRYLIRDVDHKVTAAEYFSVGEWISSGIKFHRMHFATSFIGPLTASLFGGSYEGRQGIKDIKETMERFPYRMVYGDDEIFTKYVIWPHMKKSNSILTHKYNRGLSFVVCNPYEGSSEDNPTSMYCNENPKGYVDLVMPDGVTFPLIYLAYNMPLKNLQDQYFDLNKVKNPRVRRSFQSLYGDNYDFKTLPSPDECQAIQNEPGLLEMLSQIMIVRITE